MCNRGGEFKRRREPPARPVLGFAFPEILFGSTCLGGERKASPPRLQAYAKAQPAKLSRLLHELVARGFLHQDGQKRWTSYRPPKNAEHKNTRSSRSTLDSSHGGDSSPKLTLDYLTQAGRRDARITCDAQRTHGSCLKRSVSSELKIPRATVLYDLRELVDANRLEIATNDSNIHGQNIG
jgi:hypothetical protein